MDDIPLPLKPGSSRFLDKLREDVTTTEIYTHVLNRGALGVISPVDN